jgi:hypothetical protein
MARPLQYPWAVPLLSERVESFEDMAPDQVAAWRIRRPRRIKSAQKDLLPDGICCTAKRPEGYFLEENYGA